MIMGILRAIRDWNYTAADQLWQERTTMKDQSMPITIHTNTRAVLPTVRQITGYPGRFVFDFGHELNMHMTAEQWRDMYLAGVAGIATALGTTQAVKDAIQQIHPDIEIVDEPETADA